MNTIQDLITHLKFISGQDSLRDADAVRLFNFAADDYSYIALTSSGRWKMDATTHKNSDGNKTYPITTATLEAGEESIPLETDFLMINQVLVDQNGKDVVLAPIDTRDSKDHALRTVYNTAGVPKKYDYNAHSLFIYPASDKNRTIKVAYSRAIPHFSTDDLTVNIGIPRIHEEYLVLHATHRLGLRTNDPNRVQVRNELAESEARVRDFFSKRDQDTPRRLKGIIGSEFMRSSRPRR